MHRDVSEVVQALMAAQEAGRRAADIAFQQLRDTHGERDIYDALAGAVLHLQVSPASTIGRQLTEVARAIPHIARVLPTGGRGEIILAIASMSRRQEQSVNIAAEQAALAVLAERLGVQGYVTSHEN